MQAPIVVNGVSPYRVVPARARAVAGEPLGRVLRIGGDAWLVLTVTLGVALLFHIGAGVRAWLIPLELIDWNHHIGSVVSDRLNETYELEQEKLKPPDPPPPPDPVVKGPDPMPRAMDQAPPPPPMAAQAGAILAAKDDGIEDLTGSWVVGTADTYGGGITTSEGKGKAVYGVAAAATGVIGGTGTNPVPQMAAPGPDRSRGIQLSGSAEWRCPFPPEADVDQMDDAYVTIQVTVGLDGKASRVAIVQDPGHGFGREAKACGLRESYMPALDHDGSPIQATKSFRIHFER